MPRPSLAPVSPRREVGKASAPPAPAVAPPRSQQQQMPPPQQQQPMPSLPSLPPSFRATAPHAAAAPEEGSPAGSVCSLSLSLRDVGPLAIASDLRDPVHVTLPGDDEVDAVADEWRRRQRAAALRAAEAAADGVDGGGGGNYRSSGGNRSGGNCGGHGSGVGGGGSRRRRHTTMVTKAEFREVVAARDEGRLLDPTRLAATAAGDGKRLVSVLLTDDELGRLQLGRE